MRVHLINPSEVFFGTAVITPRWLYVLEAATPASFGDPLLVDEALVPVDPARIQAGDIVGIASTPRTLSAGTKSGKWHAIAVRMWYSEEFMQPSTPTKRMNWGRPCGGEGGWRCGLVEGIVGLLSRDSSAGL